MPHQANARSKTREPSPPTVPTPAELTVDEILVTDDRAIIRVVTCATAVRCPRCGRRGHRVHSRYHRTVADLPWQGVPVTLELTTRKFFCDWQTCRQRVFTERLPGTVDRYARRTRRAAAILETIGLTVGARPGARLAQALGLVATVDIILRRVRQRPLVLPRTPRRLGVDDWAWKKRHTYGTLLCDLDTGRIVDLLPDRSGDTLAAWLTAHPGIEVISRDRGGEYAVAAARAAPHAIQVADRFHLLMNLTDAMTRVLTPHLTAIRAAYRQACELVDDLGVDNQDSAQRGPAGAAPGPRGNDTPSDRPAKRRGGAPPPRATLQHWKNEHAPRSSTKQAQADQRHVRRERFERAHELRRQHHSLSAIARELGVCRRTIRRWLASSRVLDWSVRAAVPRRASKTAPFHDYLRTRVTQGCLNARLLFAELQAMGYTGCYQAVRRVLAPWRPAAGQRAEPLTRRGPPSPKETTWLLRAATGATRSDLTPVETEFVRLLRDAVDDVRAADTLRARFEAMLHDHDYNALRPWLAEADQTSLRGFATGIRKDFDAVLAALCFPWSQGPTEGHVNRLKAIKRAMYGRGSFALLRQRVLHYAA